jgi:hypothetical protein
MESNPPAAITLASSIYDFFCRIYIQGARLALPSAQSAKPLWNAVAQYIGFTPTSQTDPVRRSKHVEQAYCGEY